MSENDTNTSEIEQRREVEIDGDEWVSIRGGDGYFRLFKQEWGGCAGVVYPGELGRCRDCLAETETADDDPATLVCGDCGHREVIGHGERELISEVRYVDADTNQ